MSDTFVSSLYGVIIEMKVAVSCEEFPSALDFGKVVTSENKIPKQMIACKIEHYKH